MTKRHCSVKTTQSDELKTLMLKKDYSKPIESPFPGGANADHITIGNLDVDTLNLYVVADVGGKFRKLKFNKEQERLFDLIIAQYQDGNGGFKVEVEKDGADFTK